MCSMCAHTILESMVTLPADITVSTASGAFFDLIQHFAHYLLIAGGTLGYMVQQNSPPNVLSFPEYDLNSTYDTLMQKPKMAGQIWFGNCNDYIGGAGIVDPLVFLADLIAKVLKPGQKNNDFWSSVIELLFQVK